MSLLACSMALRPASHSPCNNQIKKIVLVIIQSKKEEDKIKANPSSGKSGESCGEVLTVFPACNGQSTFIDLFLDNFTQQRIQSYIPNKVISFIEFYKQDK